MNANRKWAQRLLQDWEEEFKYYRNPGRYFESGLLDYFPTEPRAAEYANIDPPLPPLLIDRLAERGVSRLYTHQAQAITYIRGGMDTVITCSTASGKTLCFQLPLFEQILTQPHTTGLLIYPTKALAQDQLRSLREFEIAELRPNTYDGDTDQNRRRHIRNKANVVLTNPDMLHVGILPNHDKWHRFFSNLSMVIIDEMHMMRGIFGTHVALILRRLQRICAQYQTQPPTFVYTSATISNPGELARLLSGRERVAVVDNDTSPQASQWIALWNPPQKVRNRKKDRESDQKHAVSPSQDSTDKVAADDDWKQDEIPPHQQTDEFEVVHTAPEKEDHREAARWSTVRLVKDLVRRERPTIGFTLSRRDTELVYLGLQEDLSGHLGGKVKAYRGGYQPEERRQIEKLLFTHELLAVIATNALELGIDIGSLDAVVMTGFPGTIASFWQQSGRAGRKHDESLVVLVASDNPLDQYLIRNGRELTEREPEGSIINPDNPEVLQLQLGCAAKEMPLQPENDQNYFGGSIFGVVSKMLSEQQLRPRENFSQNADAANTLIWSGEPKHPASRISIRNIDWRSYKLLHQKEVLEISEWDRVIRENHPGAIVLHQGKKFKVTSVDHAERIVNLDEKQEVDYYTQSGSTTHLEVVEVNEEVTWGPITMKKGKVNVFTQVTSYREYQISSKEEIGVHPLENYPAIRLKTQAVWWEISGEISSRLGGTTASSPPTRSETGPQPNGSSAHQTNNTDSSAASTATEEKWSADKFWKAVDPDRWHQAKEAKSDSDSSQQDHQTGRRSDSESTSETNRSDPSGARTNDPKTETQTTESESAATIPYAELAIASLHGAEHAAISMLPLIAACERWDVAGISTTPHPDTGKPTIFIYETIQGGAGLSNLIFDRGGELIYAAKGVIDNCKCDDGCPSCVHSSRCGTFNESLSKAGAQELLGFIYESFTEKVGEVSTEKQVATV